MPSLADLRAEYALASLDEREVAPDPLDQFARWLGQARNASLPEPNAMTLATVHPDGTPAARIVLLKAFDADGYVFYSNALSVKGTDLAAHAHAALLFYWAALERQVRIEGAVGRVSDDEADAYFASRPRASRIGAWASPQSQPIADRAWLENRFGALNLQHREAPVPRPPHWVGYRVRPARYEFWQGRASRLHDRIVYLPHGAGWKTARLAP